jgi:hypothetical protein
MFDAGVSAPFASDTGLPRSLGLESNWWRVAMLIHDQARLSTDVMALCRALASVPPRFGRSIVS